MRCISAVVLLFSAAMSVTCGAQDLVLVAQAKETQGAQRAIRIRVVGPEGKPMAGVKIHASVWTKEPFKANRDFVSDAHGEAVVELPRTVDILRLWRRRTATCPCSPSGGVSSSLTTTKSPSSSRSTSGGGA